MSAVQQIWEGAKGAVGNVAEELWNRVSTGGNLLGLPGKNALDKSAEMDVPYRPGMTMGQMIQPNWQENPMLSAFGPGNVIGRAEQGLMAARPAPMPAPGAPPPIGPRPSTVQPGTGPQTVFSGAQPVAPVARPATVQPTSGPVVQVPAAPGSAMQSQPPAPPVAVPTSALASAIAADNPVAVDQAVTRGYRQAIQPGQTGVKMNNPGLAQEDQRIMTVVDKIIANRKDLRLTNADGSAAPEGTMPRTRRQFLEAQDQTKKALFREFDEMNRQAGSMGIHVDPSPAIQHLREIEVSPAVVDGTPAVAAEAKRFADAMERRGVYTPEAMQELIQDINGRLSSFYKSPTSGSATEGRILAPVVDMLRAQLDNAIEGAVGPGYQTFRTQYGALRSVEKDLTNAARKELSQRPGLMSEFADLMASDSFIRGVFTLNPATIAKAGFLKAAKEVVKYGNDPNRAIERLFQRRLSSQTQPSPSLGQSLMLPAAREMSRPEIEQDQSGVGYRVPSLYRGGGL